MKKDFAAIRRLLAQLRLFVAAAIAAASTAACSPGGTVPGTPALAAEDRAGARSFAILAFNDTYRIGGVEDGRVGGPARLRSLRRALERDYPDLLLLQAGDFLSPSFLGRSYGGAQMIDVLNLLDGDGAAFDSRMFVTFGNHEFDRGKLAQAPLLNDRIAGSQFTWLGSNIRFARGADGRPLVGGENLTDSRVVESGAVRVGLFSLTLNSNWPAYVVDFAAPIERARRLTALLRAQGAEFVVALTHLPIAGDKAVLETLGPAGPDLIVGGHEHSRQSWPADAPRLFKADADLRSASVILVTLPASGPATVAQRFEDLAGDDPVPDPQVDARVQDWIARHDMAFCAERALPAGCLDRVIGRTATTLVAEEIDIRSRETNLGDWLADVALDAFRAEGAEVAFINSGSLRLNQNLPAGSPITRRDIEELFQFDSDLRLIEIDGHRLKAVLAKAAEGWPGHGRWLQVAGLAFRHDPQSGEVSDVTLLTPAGPRPLADDARVRAVTGTYLLDPTIGDQDGYGMLGLQDIVPGAPQDVTLRREVLQALAAAAPTGIAPVAVGRICQPARPRPCLALGPR